MPIDRRSPGAMRALGILVLLAVFAAGALVATAVDRVLMADEPATAAQSGDCRHRHDFLDQVSLTDSQRVEIDAILDRRRAQADRFWDDARPTLKAIMDSARSEIRSVMTAEQRAAYDRLREDHRAARRAAEDAEDKDDR